MTAENNEIIRTSIQDQIKRIFNEYATGGYWLEISADDLDTIAKRIEAEVVIFNSVVDFKG
jgi:hypothetical protein